MLDTDQTIFDGVLRLGDNALILGQRVSGWCGHAPVLEEDIALANVALDLIGQAKLWLGLAAEIEGKHRSADDLAYLRDSRAFRNALLVEQPNGDYGRTLMRQFLFDAWHVPMLRALSACRNERIVEIAQKSLKEALYHLERSEDLIIRLGDGSEESNRRMQSALDMLWPFAGELIACDDVDHAFADAVGAPEMLLLDKPYSEYTQKVLNQAVLTVTPNTTPRMGGKVGLHSEDFGVLLAEMQWLQRAYPGARW